ncbi:NYN domain-containing protein [Myxococcota bacterium]|nr:NYN domain-containing protein [Myxococcota bacterium]
MRVRVFIDFWNFQLTWNERGGGARCDWTMLPTALVNAASGAIGPAGLGALTLEETRVYAGYEAGRESQLGNWLHNFLDRQPGVRVFTSERHWRKQPVYCPNCRTEHETCVVCGADFGRAAEKTIDARIVTDLVGLAWEDAYDVAILVSADKDFIPAVEHVQAKNFKVINATWRKRGHQLAKVAWASFYLDDVAARIARA